ncbi:MAG: hypothetical protein HOM74_05260 [Proteobacteria bacterium]|jgi:hypothetical protein|nr:hypothetical protein [Pseudomonadota bacterium]
MFSLLTTFFYMLTLYFSFIVGFSEEASYWFLPLLPAGLSVGYALDRWTGVKELLYTDQPAFIRFVTHRYLSFVPHVSAAVGSGLALNYLVSTL